MQHRTVILTVIICEYVASFLFMRHYFANVNNFSKISFFKKNIFLIKICTTQKMKLPLRNFSVKVTKSNGNCKFGYIYKKKNT